MLEIIVADHCNISCRQCNHGSPAMRKWVADPDDVHRHLVVLAKCYRPRMLKLIGGEPLLHPDLPGLIAAARASGICDRFELVTNGTLLDRATDAVWRSVHEIALSHYAAVGDMNGILERAAAKARQFGVKLTITSMPHFRDTFSAVGTKDSTLVGRVFAACKLANVWGIHALYRGRIFKCPQSIYAPRLAGRTFEEGMEIRDSPGFQTALLAFLNSRQPLASCHHCIGTSGKEFPHRFLARDEWAADLRRPVEDMVDHDLLDRALAETIPAGDRVPSSSEG